MAETNVLAKKFHVITKYIQSREQAAESNSTVQLIKTAELSALKIHYRDIAALIDAGYLEKVKQGCYKVVFSKEISEPSASIIASLPGWCPMYYTALFYTVIVTVHR